MPRPIIAPSVLASDFGQLSAECKRMIKGGAEWLHMGTASQMTSGGRAIDYSAPPQMSWMGPPVLSCISKAVPGIFMDCHMMVAQPEKWVNDIADAGGSLYCFHIEATSDAVSLIRAIHERKMKAGVAISPDTSSTAITDEIGAAADMLLVMTVYPGRGGQKFIERCVPKVAELRARFPDKDIEVDGGVGPKTVGVCAKAGSNVIVAGTAVFGAPSPEDVIAELKASVAAAQGSKAQTP
ncbi:ribulose-5-phosphate 3-epimerase [Boletus reticuloceps]|uniref:Ribulose-phosphate 3-epimerase n=1 Tax=Boletus reticuloceps TaxID=495285 RepID=A0A8I2YZS2_9AGAM|nr:ribulose-5-phosphate 3-epimerase [Boletus reticuloceps]